MAVDHTRALPVAPERLEALAPSLFGKPYAALGWTERRELYAVALAGEQVEWSQQVAFFLQEAHDIYNGRFR